MGYWKNKAMEAEEDYDWARSLLVEVGALEECEYHEGTFFEGNEEVTAAYKLANARITSGDYKLKEGQTRRNVTDLILAVYQDNSALSSCPICDKNFGPD
jgi:hypothetical protein